MASLEAAARAAADNMSKEDIERAMSKEVDHKSTRVSSRRRSKSMEIMQTSDFTPEAALVESQSEDEDTALAKDVAFKMIKPAEADADAGVITPGFPEGVAAFLRSQTVEMKDKLKDEDAAALARILEANVVTRMVLSNNTLGDTTAVALSKALRTNTSLEYLSLHNNNIGEFGGIALADSLTKNETLKTLFLTRNPITENAAMALTNANAARRNPMKGLSGLVTDQGML